MKITLTVSFVLLLIVEVFSQRTNDTTFHFGIEKPSYLSGAGPVILIDEAHNNRHTKSGGLFALARILEDDGFVVAENKSSFTKEALGKASILVIVNALHDSNNQSWTLPCPSAFTKKEINNLKSWLAEGGKLFLSADHMPYGGAVQELAKSLNIEWNNGFAMNAKKKNDWPPSSFSRGKNTLLSSPVTDPSQNIRKIEEIATFTGSAFKSEEAVPFLIFDDSHELLEPKTAWKFSKDTKVKSAEGWYHGACLVYGKGKLVLMGESAMFTSSVRGRTKVGMNSQDAPENAQLALNIFRYLAE